MFRPRRALIFFSLALGWATAPTPTGAADPATAAPPVDFARDIQPILQSRCAECHSAAKMKGGLRLDQRAALLKGGDSGRASIAPGDPAGSLLYKLVTGAEGEPDIPAMPPKGGPLSAEQIDALRRWIEQGAHWPGQEETETARHWSFGAPQKAPLPRVNHPEWIRNPIDAFVLARMEAEGLEPAPEADRATLLRRLSLDLVGLPPTPEEVEAFAADARPDAYARQIERLLASPRYGERWARPWLDLARYADTNGYEKDKPREVWMWRDWVINALNANMPYDQFTVEQLAGDLLPGATESQIIATGFQRNTLLNDEGGIDPEEFRMIAVIDRVNTIGETWLGLTVGCAQCHNHKYDPISQKDYYQLFAHFNSTADNGRDPEPRRFRPSAAQSVELRKAGAEIEMMEEQWAAPSAALDARRADWERRIRDGRTEWRAVKPLSAKSLKGAELTINHEDETILAGGENPENDEYEITARTDLKRATAIRLEVLTDPSLPLNGPGRNAENGSFVLNRLRLQAAPANFPLAAKSVELNAAAADYTQEGHSAAALFAPDGGKGSWAIECFKEELRRPREVALLAARPIENQGGSILIARLIHGFGKGHNLGKFRLSVADDPDAVARIGTPPAVMEALRAPDRSPEQSKLIADHYRSVDPELMKLREKIEAKKKAFAALPRDSTLVLTELPQPRPTNILKRGDVFQKGDPVEPGTLSVLPPPPPDAPRNRLGLARWLVSRDNPLTARVTVNRAWAGFFGRAIVPTVNDFGARGDKPSHPELLDWLAVELMNSGWDMKALHRLIASSATYRQSAAAPAALHARDPLNELLARGPRFRVEAEAIRDVALTAGGLLSDEIGGPSVFPPQPPGIFDASFSVHDIKAKWVDDEGPPRYRRGLYTFMKRTAPYPSMILFDGPRREVCVAQRSRTNTPTQALVTLNDPVFMEAAGGLARRMAREGGPEPESRLARGFRICLARAPEPEEVAALAKLYAKARARYEADPAAARKLVAASRAMGAPAAAASNPSGEGAPTDAAVADLAAWVAAANALLNLDETLTKG